MCVYARRETRPVILPSNKEKPIPYRDPSTNPTKLSDSIGFMDLQLVDRSFLKFIQHQKLTTVRHKQRQEPREYTNSLKRNSPLYTLHGDLLTDLLQSLQVCLLLSTVDGGYCGREALLQCLCSTGHLGQAEGCHAVHLDSPSCLPVKAQHCCKTPTPRQAFCTLPIFW